MSEAHITHRQTSESMSSAQTQLAVSRADFKDTTFMQVARTVGQLGTCDRAKVGAAIVRDGRCVSWGYNGAPPGMPHCWVNVHGWANKYPQGTGPDTEWEEGELRKWQEHQAAEHGCRNVTHAEANALAFAARQGISTDGATLYVSMSPCLNCSKLIIAAGIQRVVVEHIYRDPAGWDLIYKAFILRTHLGV